MSGSITLAVPPPAGTEASEPPSGAHRGLALVAAISLAIGTRSAWTIALTADPVVMLGLSASYLVVLGSAVLAVTVRTRRGLIVVEALILATGAAMVLAMLALHHRPSDEGAIVVQAARSWLDGGEVYGVPWPSLFSSEHMPVTRLMDGGADYTFGYPPLAVWLTAPAVAILGSITAASVVTTLALLAGAVALWALLPGDRRSAATMLMLGFPFLPHYARLGYPAIIAMVLLIPVAARWTSIGVDGRLGRRGVVLGICVGAACAAQQLAWFVVPFLLVGLFAVRRGTATARASALIVAAFAGVAALTWMAIDLPFMVRDAQAWAAGVMLVLTQHAIPHGQGLIDVSFYVTDGSAALGMYTLASASLMAALLLTSVLWMRRLGPALTILPWIVFYTAVRSQDGYFLLMTPVWLAALAGATPDAFADAWQPRLRIAARLPPMTRRSGRRRAGVLLPVASVIAMLMPSLVFATEAITSDEPIELTVIQTAAHGPGDHGVWQLVVRATNESTVALMPHFAVSVGQGITPFWSASDGPALLGPHVTATYRLTAPTPEGYSPGRHGYLLLRALTDAPETVSTTRIGSDAAPG